MAVLDSRPPGKAGAGGRGREGRLGGRVKEGRRETEGGEGEREGGGEGKVDDEGGRETGRRKTVAYEIYMCACLLRPVTSLL